MAQSFARNKKSRAALGHKQHEEVVWRWYPSLATAGRQSDRYACCILESRIRCYRGCMTTASDRSILDETSTSAGHADAERGAYHQHVITNTL